jgi:hypothetical protein
MPYDAPLLDVAALHFAVMPDAGLFHAGDSGTLAADASGRLQFTAGEGPVRRLSILPEKRQEALDALLEMVTRPPQAPAPQGRGAA